MQERKGNKHKIKNNKKQFWVIPTIHGHKNEGSTFIVMDKHLNYDSILCMHSNIVQSRAPQYHGHTIIHLRIWAKGLRVGMHQNKHRHHVLHTPWYWRADKLC